MLKNWRFVIILVVGIFAAILTADWAYARSRLPGITIETSLETPHVVADGVDTAKFVLTVTENGQPRANDLVQLWLIQGSGQLIPQWVFTDEQGQSEISFTPNRYNSYDPQDFAEIAIKDTNIGRLIEVGKETTIVIPIAIPE